MTNNQNKVQNKKYFLFLKKNLIFAQNFKDYKYRKNNHLNIKN